MKIKAKNPKVRSMRLTVPCDGIIQVDANGIADVSKAAAEVLVKNSSDWGYYKGDEEALKGSDSEDVTEEEFVTEIREMSIGMLNKLAVMQGFPKEEYDSFRTKQTLMAEYLVNKYKSGAIVDEEEVDEPAVIIENEQKEEIEPAADVVIEEDEKEAEEGEGKDEEEGEEMTEEDVRAKSFTELKALATELELPEDEWKKIRSQKEMAQYIIDTFAEED